MQYLIILLEGGCVAGEYMYEQEQTATNHAALWLSGSDDNDVILYRLKSDAPITADRVHGTVETPIYEPVA